MQLVPNTCFFPFLSCLPRSCLDFSNFSKSQKLMMKCWIVSSYDTWPTVTEKGRSFSWCYCSLLVPWTDLVISSFSLLNWQQTNKAKLVNCFLWGELNCFSVSVRWHPQKNSVDFIYLFIFNLLNITVFYLVNITECCKKLSSLFIFPILIRILKAVFNCLIF